MKLIPYEAEHARNLVLREVEKPVQNLPDFEQWAEINEGPFAWSALYGDSVVACGGVRDMWDGVGEAWLLLGADSVQFRVPICMAVREKLDEALTKYHRIQAHARMDFSLAHIFLRKLGFREEGYMRAYYPDKMGALLYSIVRED
jgi:hypothetical protein